MNPFTLLNGVVEGCNTKNVTRLDIVEFDVVFSDFTKEKGNLGTGAHYRYSALIFEKREVGWLNPIPNLAVTKLKDDVFRWGVSRVSDNEVDTRRFTILVKNQPRDDESSFVLKLQFTRMAELSESKNGCR